MDEDILWPDTPFPLQPSLVLVGRRGSESHGTFIPSSDPNSIDDRDLMGVCIPPEPWTLGLRTWEGAESIKGCWDVVLYDFRKFVRLLCKQNPNVLGMLWLEPEDYLYRSPAADKLIAARDLFRARRPAFDAFAGYAQSQIKKMQGGAFAGYMGDKRKRLVDKHGFDVKNACHLIRLLNMGEEYLSTGQLRVRRTWDRDMLMSIKRGEWSLAKVKDYAAGRFEDLSEASRDSVLPEAVDEDAVNDLVVEIMRERVIGGGSDRPTKAPSLVEKLRDAGFQRSGNPLYDEAADALEIAERRIATLIGDWREDKETIYGHEKAMDRLQAERAAAEARIAELTRERNFWEHECGKVNELLSTARTAFAGYATKPSGPVMTDAERKTEMNRIWKALKTLGGDELAHHWLWSMTPFPVGLPDDEQLEEGRRLAAADAAGRAEIMKESARRVEEAMMAATGESDQ